MADMFHRKDEKLKSRMDIEAHKGGTWIVIAAVCTSKQANWRKHQKDNLQIEI